MDVFKWKDFFSHSIENFHVFDRLKHVKLFAFLIQQSSKLVLGIPFFLEKSLNFHASP